MEAQDGHLFIKNLAQFIHTHEQALASALQSQHRSKKSTSSEVSVASSLSDVLTRPFTASSASNIKPAKLSLTPHHLYYLLTRFEELGVTVGTLNVRLENIHAGTPGNYVSFLGNAPRKGRRQADTDSLRSVSSVRSVMSNVSSIWSSLKSSVRDGKRETQHREDMRYLYSCFTKIPALRLSPDPRARLVAGFEEFPFDTAVPLFVFKNLSSLEIDDLDFRQIYGWDTLARQLRSLTVRAGHVEDPLDILVDIVLDDIDKRRRRSSRAPVPTTPSTPGGSWIISPKPVRQAEMAYSTSGPMTPFAKTRSGSLVELPTTVSLAANNGSVRSTGRRSASPPPLQRPGSGSIAVINHNLSEDRRSSSQGSSIRRTSSRQKSVDLTTMAILPATSWQFLRHLSLADNSLHYVSASSFSTIAGSLQSLDLSNNLFTEIPDALATFSQLRALNLSNCMIESLRSLAQSPLPAITTLNLRNNRIYSLAGIEKLYSLEKIDLRENKFADPTELARMSSIPYLSHVYVARNPFTKTHQDYRVTIFNVFRRVPGRTEDILIDHIGPMYNEKRKLEDWVPELPPPAVIKPAVEDEHTDVEPSSPPEPFTPHKPSLDIDPTRLSIDSNTRRRKSGRPRIVQLDASNSGTRRSPAIDATTPDKIDENKEPHPGLLEKGSPNIKRWPVEREREPSPSPLGPGRAARQLSMSTRTLGSAQAQ